MRTAAQLLWLTLALATLALLAAGGAAPATQALPRATADRPDDRPGPQVHLVYAVPSNGADNQLDTDGTLSDTIAVWEQWFVQQTGNRVLRLDTYQGQPDITFIRSPLTAQHIANQAPNELATFENVLVGAGLIDPSKLYGIYYDGATSVNLCGRGGDLVAVVYLKRNSLADCEPVPFAHPGEPARYREFIMVHELLHGLGFVEPCAPHYALDSHVAEPADVMYGGPILGNDQQLDVGRDDYFEAHIPGCKDLADSPYLAPAPPGPPGPPTAVAGDGHATVSFTPASGPLTGYVVTSTPGGITATGAASPITVTGLNNWTSYTFVVRAKNGAEVGPASAASNAVTPFAPPPAPTNVAASAGDGQARVSFSEPAVGAGPPIVYYTATAFPGGESASAVAAPVVVDGLANGTSYTFTVTATSALGTSAASAPSGAVVPIGIERPHGLPPPEAPRPAVPGLAPAPSPRRPPAPPPH